MGPLTLCVEDELSSLILHGRDEAWHSVLDNVLEKCETEISSTPSTYRRRPMIASSSSHQSPVKSSKSSNNFYIRQKCHSFPNLMSDSGVYFEMDDDHHLFSVRKPRHCVCKKPRSENVHHSNKVGLRKKLFKTVSTGILDLGLFLDKPEKISLLSMN